RVRAVRRGRRLLHVPLVRLQNRGQRLGRWHLALNDAESGQPVGVLRQEAGAVRAAPVLERVAGPFGPVEAPAAGDPGIAVVPARQAYSHSASVGRRNGLPSRRDSHSQNATARCQVTNVTGSSSVLLTPALPRSFLWFGSNCSYWAFVTSVVPR